MYADKLRKWALDNGFKIGWGPWDAVEQAVRDVQELRRNSELDEAFDREMLSRVVDPGGPMPPLGRWVILVMAPAPAYFVTFTLEGKPVRVVIPPTYIRFGEIGREIRESLSSEVLGGSHLEPLPTALKSVAARLGLTVYGRNNIAYSEGFGSYFQLVGCATTIDLSEGAAEIREPGLLEACRSCNSCAEVCPTWAISEDRFLLKAERCIVFFNERTEEFPGWIPADAHRCLVGCLLCQSACPENAGRLETKDSGLLFDEEETRCALEPGTDPKHPSLLRAGAKLATLQITEDQQVFWRNLRALVRPLKA